MRRRSVANGIANDILSAHDVMRKTAGAQRITGIPGKRCPTIVSAVGRQMQPVCRWLRNVFTTAALFESGRTLQDSSRRRPAGCRGASRRRAACMRASSTASLTLRLKGSVRSDDED
jgi:hypothetical protein